MSLLNNIPNGGRAPEFTGDPKNQMDILEYQNECQAFWAAVQAAQNQENQEATAESNLQKSRHDAVMSIIGNIGRG